MTFGGVLSGGYRNKKLRKPPSTASKKSPRELCLDVEILLQNQAPPNASELKSFGRPCFRTISRQSDDRVMSFIFSTADILKLSTETVETRVEKRLQTRALDGSPHKINDLAAPRRGTSVS
jgi:hypothetical protein